MTYREEDWLTVCRRLASAHQHYSDYQAEKDRSGPNPDFLDDGIFKCWAFGEYAINVARQCFGLSPVKDHSQPQRAKELFEAGKLQCDYSGILQSLELFRKKASHLGYVKERSTHYSSADLKRSLEAMDSLQAEVVALLAGRKRL